MSNHKARIAQNSCEKVDNKFFDQTLKTYSK